MDRPPELADRFKALLAGPENKNIRLASSNGDGTQ
jgi:hypothetical protein